MNKTIWSIIGIAVIVGSIWFYIELKEHRRLQKLDYVKNELFNMKHSRDMWFIQQRGTRSLSQTNLDSVEQQIQKDYNYMYEGQDSLIADFERTLKRMEAGEE